MYRCTPQSSAQRKEQEEKERVRDSTELDIKDKGVGLRESERKVKKMDEENTQIVSHEVYGSMNVPLEACMYICYSTIKM